MLDRISRYFDLQSERRTSFHLADSGPPAPAPVLPQYLALSAGVIIEPYLSNYIANGSWGLDPTAVWGRIAFGLVIGVAILPGVYKAAFDPGKPIAVQLMALFPMGLGWQSLFTAATKAAG